MTAPSLKRAAGTAISRAVLRRLTLDRLEPLPSFESHVFTLSFDCDNDADADAFPSLIELLRVHGVAASFAVCGRMVQERPDAYRRLIDAGHEIVNHGYSKHLTRIGPHVVSTLFYDRMSAESIRHEIQSNHAAVRDALGYEMIGFRVPHFGYYQRRECVATLFAILRDLGYRYDTSLTGYTFLRQRRLLKAYPLIDFPLSPHPYHPRTVLDSWGYMGDGRRDRDGFVRDFKLLVDLAVAAPGWRYLNIYVDPAHVAGWAGFGDCLSYVNSRTARIHIATYRDLLLRDRVAAGVGGAMSR